MDKFGIVLYFSMLITLPHPTITKSFDVINTVTHPTFLKEKATFYTQMDFAIFTIKVNFTNLHLNSLSLLNKIKDEFAWYKQKQKSRMTNL